MSKRIVVKSCENRERPCPPGCGHFYGYQEQCLLGERTDPEWIVGLAVWRDLMDRRGIKHELENCELYIQIEIVESMGRAAIAATSGLKGDA